MYLLNTDLATSVALFYNAGIQYLKEKDAEKKGESTRKSKERERGR